MAVRKLGASRLQRVRAFPRFNDFSAKTFQELAQKLGRFERSLRGMIGDLGSLLLTVVDGNRSPDAVYENIETMRFTGPAVSIVRTSEGYVTVTVNAGYLLSDQTPQSVGTANSSGSQDEAARIDHVHSLEGVDGIDTETGVVRASRDYLTATLTTTQNNYEPTGWDTADGTVITANSGSPGFTGFAAPSADGTRERIIICDRASTNSLAIFHQSGSSSLGNRVTCPGLATISLAPGDCARILYTDDDEWQVTAVGRTSVVDHGALTGLADDDHLQYLLVDGTRALGGNWSLGNFDLSDANAITFNGDLSGIYSVDTIVLHDGASTIDVNQGDLIDVDNITNSVDAITISTAADNITLTSATDVFAIATNEVELSGTTIDVNGSGGITLDTTDGTISLTAVGTGRDVLITATDQVDLTGNVIDINGAASMTLDTTDGSLAITANGTGRTLFLNSDGVVDVNGDTGIALDTVDGGIGINANGTGRDVTITAGDDVIVTPTDDLVLNPGDLVNCSDKPVVHMLYAGFDDNEPPAAGSGDTYVSTNNGGWRVRGTGSTHLLDYTEYVSVGTDSGTDLTLDLNDVGGIDFAEGIFFVTSELLLTPQTASSDLSYGEYKKWWIYYHHGTNSYVVVQCDACQAWNPDGYLVGGASVNATTHVLTLTKDTLSYACDRMWRVTITAKVSNA